MTKTYVLSLLETIEQNSMFQAKALLIELYYTLEKVLNLFLLEYSAREKADVILILALTRKVTDREVRGS